MINGIQIKCLSADQTLAVLELALKCDAPLPENAMFTGTIRGPYSERSHTLPADFPLATTASGALTARIVDPCYDSDDLPMEYEVNVTVQSNGETIAQHQSRVQLRANV